MNDLKPIFDLLHFESLFLVRDGVSTPVTRAANEFMERYRGLTPVIKECVDSGNGFVRDAKFENSDGRRKFRDSDSDSLSYSVLLKKEGETLVAVNVTKLYKDIEEESKITEKACELCPQPFALIRLDPVSGKSEGLFATQAFCDTYGMSESYFKEAGIPALAARSLPEDRHLCDIYVPACVKQMRESVQVMRVLTRENVYRWYRQWSALTIARDRESVLGTCQVEDFEETAHAILQSMKENRSAMMLMSMGQTVFDFSACLDRKMRVLIMSENAKNLLLVDPGKLATGAPFESFISLDSHKLNFRAFLETRLNEPHTMVGATTCKVRMNLIGNRFVEVSVLVMPLQSKDLVLCHSLSEPSAKGISLLAAKLLLPAEIETCFYMGCTLVDRSLLKRFSKVGGGKGGKYKIPAVPSSRGVVNYEKSSGESSPSLPSRGWSSVTSLFWNLMRDLDFSLSLVYGPHSHDWFSPLYRMAFPELEKEELVRLLPNHLQTEFIDAANRADFNTCSQLLTYSVQGNASIFPPGFSKVGKISLERDAIRCAFRFFLGLVPLLSNQPARQFALLAQLDDSRKLFISRKLDASENILLLYHFTLVLISTAHQSLEYFATDRCMHWLRHTLSEFLTAPEIQLVHPGSKLAIVYWTCLLWASLMHALRREAEAVATLTQTLADIDLYCVQHPFVASVRDLQCLALHNLCTAASDKQNDARLAELKSQLEAATSHARLSGARARPLFAHPRKLTAL